MQAEKQPAVIFSQRLRLLSRQNDCNQIELAKEFGVSQAAVSKWFNGSIPSHAILLKMALKFGVPTGYLLGLDIESASGILPPASIISPPESRPETGSIKNITISRKGEGKGEEGDEIMAIAALLREAAERLEAYHRKQKGK
jgi:transcriptional regulator with XRE-family HTH domain